MIDYKGARARCEAATPGHGYVMVDAWGAVEIPPPPGVGSLTEADAELYDHARADLPAALDAVAVLAKYIEAHAPINGDLPADVAAILAQVKP